MSNPSDIHQAVREHYGSIAVNNLSGCCDPMVSSGACCNAASASDGCGCNTQLYDDKLTNGLPIDVTGLSLGCGDPVTIATLREGETVVDLGSGGGIDCFIAARQVGPTGHVIGVDMTPEMIEKARANSSKVNLDTSNVEFRQGQIEALPVEDNSVDVILSNCVINLSPCKEDVFKEAYRVLKAGGRVAISDIVTTGVLSPVFRANLEQWAACVAGAVDVRQYFTMMEAAGFTEIQVVDKVTASNLLGLPGVVPQIISARITARKPAAK